VKHKGRESGLCASVDTNTTKVAAAGVFVPATSIRGEPDMSESQRPLTARRRRFVLAYLRGGNATKAAIAAGYSPRSAASIASELRRMPNVKAAIEAGQARRAAPHRWTPWPSASWRSWRGKPSPT
jgi:hypothetical protein